MKQAFWLFGATLFPLALACGEADFGAGNDKSSQPNTQFQSEDGKAVCNGSDCPLDAVTANGQSDGADGGGSGGNPDQGVTPGDNFDPSDGGEGNGGEGSGGGGGSAGGNGDNNACNTDKGPGGSRLKYDGSTFEVHGTNAGDNITVRPPPSGREGAVFLIINNAAGQEFFCPGRLAVFGHAGDDTIDVTPVPGLTSMSVDGGN